MLSWLVIVMPGTEIAVEMAKGVRSGGNEGRASVGWLVCLFGRCRIKWAYSGYRIRRRRRRRRSNNQKGKEEGKNKLL